MTKLADVPNRGKGLGLFLSCPRFCGYLELPLLSVSSFRLQSPVFPLENHEFIPVFMFSPGKAHLLLPDVLPQLFSASVSLLTADRILGSGPDSGVGDLLFSFMKRGSTLRTISVGRRCAVVRVAKAPAPLFMILRVWIGRPLN